MPRRRGWASGFLSRDLSATADRRKPHADLGKGAVDLKYRVRIVDRIPVKLDPAEVLGLAEFRRLRDREGEVRRLLQASSTLMRPRGVFTLLAVESISNGTVHLEGGHVLNSIVLADAARPGRRVAPYVITIGPELEDEASRMSQTDIFGGWLLARIGDYALGKASLYVRSLIEGELGKSPSSFSPGTGTGRLFGIEQQKVLFDILAPQNSIGVTLTLGYVMVPFKSISGVFAAADGEYVACRYCPGGCRYRKAEYSGEYLAVKRGGEECDGSVQSDCLAPVGGEHTLADATEGRRD